MLDNIIRICHIRGEREYWTKKDHTYKWCNINPNITTNVIFDCWNKLCKIEYYSFRKQVRDIIIDKIIKTNEFDEICLDNESLSTLTATLSPQNNILYFAQDDDDLFLGGITSEFYNTGVYHTLNVRIDPVEFCRIYRTCIGSNLTTDTPINASLFHFPGREQRNNSPIITAPAQKLIPVLNLVSNTKYDTHLIGNPGSKLYDMFLKDLPFHTSDLLQDLRKIHNFDVVYSRDFSLKCQNNICNRHICTHNMYPHSLTFIKRLSYLFWGDIILRDNNVPNNIDDIVYYFIKSWFYTAKKLKINNKEWDNIIDLYCESFDL